MWTVYSLVLSLPEWVYEKTNVSTKLTPVLTLGLGDRLSWHGKSRDWYESVSTKVLTLEKKGVKRQQISGHWIPVRHYCLLIPFYENSQYEE